MGEIVWAKTHEHRDHLKGHTYGEVPADTRITVFADKNKVCMVDSTMIIGANRSSGKYYYRWRSVSSVGFFRNRAGHLQPYRAVRPLKQSAWNSYYPETAFYYLEEDDAVAGEPMKAFREACKQYLHLRGAYDLYPMARVMEMPERFSLLPANLRPYMRVTDWTEFMTGAFGKSRVTSDLIKAAQETEPYIVSIAREFRGLVPDKEIVDFIKRSKFDEEMMNEFNPHTPRLRAVLRLLNDKSRLELIASPLDLEGTRSIQLVSSRTQYWKNNQQAYKNRIGQHTGITDWNGLTRLA
jgi:hypothetical protein